MAGFIPNIEDHLLARFLAGETTDAENAMISEWLQADEAHSRRLEAFRRIWEAGAGLNAGETFNTDAAWQKVRAKTVDRPAARIIPLWRKAAIWGGLLAAAGAAWWWISVSQAPEQIAFKATKTGDSLVLADASVIRARAGAGIVYTTNFDRQERRVKLTGEAFFRVTRNTSRPFRVQTGYTEVEVLGTEFNVRATDTVTTVYVQHGKVKVSAGGDFVILTPGQSATVKPGGKPQRQEQADPNQVGYLTRSLQFRDATLAEVQTMLLQQFGIRIKLDVKHPEGCRISTRFRGETPEQIMEVLSATLNLTWSQQNGVYTLKGAGCK